MVPPKSGHVHCEKTVFQTLFFGVPSQGYGVGAIYGGDRLGVGQTRRIPFDHVLQPFISAYHILSLKTFGELQLVFFPPPPPPPCNTSKMQKTRLCQLRRMHQSGHIGNTGVIDGMVELSLAPVGFDLKPATVHSDLAQCQAWWG